MRWGRIIQNNKVLVGHGGRSMRILLKGAITGGLIVFLWSAVSWMALPYHGRTLGKFQDEPAVQRALVSNILEPGIYILPHPDQALEKSTDTQARITAQRKRVQIANGPFAFVAVQTHGIGAMPVQLARSLAIQILGSLLMTWLLLQTGPISYRRRVFFVVVVAMTGGILSHLPQWNWWGFPDDYTLMEMLDLLAGWLLGGLALAKIVPVSVLSIKDVVQGKR